MAHLRAFIPACETFGWTGAPGFRTRIKMLVNGRERRNADWDSERNRYTVPFQNLDAEEYASIRRMFGACRGMLHNFLYRDPLDDSAMLEEFAVADGRGTYQLSKLSVIDGVPYQRPVRALYVPGEDGEAVEADPIIYVDGTPAAAAIDHDRGLVTFAVDPEGSVLSWSGFFAVWVRFDADDLPFQIADRRGSGDYARSGQVSLLEYFAPELTS